MNANTTIEVVEDTLIVAGVGISITNIQTILGITLLIVQIVLIIAKSGYALYKKIKNKDIKGAIEEVKDAKEQVQTLVDKYNQDANGKSTKQK